MPRLVTLRRLLIAAGIVAGAAVLAAGILLFSVWRSVRTGALLEPEALAGPDTVALLSFTVRTDDPGVAAALVHLQEMESRRKHSRLPPWARWLLAGSGAGSLSPQAAAVMPLRILASLDRAEDGHEWGVLVLSLSRYSDRIRSVLGTDPGKTRHGVAVATPKNPSDPYAALAGNNIVLSGSEAGLDRAIDRLAGDDQPSELYRTASEAAPRRAAGFAVVLNPGDRLERMAHEALGKYGIEALSQGQPTRLLPRDLLASGFSLDLVDADRARVEGAFLFADDHAAAEGERWVRRGLPVSIALLGLEPELKMRRDGHTLHVNGTLRGLDALWDRLLAGRLFP